MITRDTCCFYGIPNHERRVQIFLSVCLSNLLLGGGLVIFPLSASKWGYNNVTALQLSLQIQVDRQVVLVVVVWAVRLHGPELRQPLLVLFHSPCQSAGRHWAQLMPPSLQTYLSVSSRPHHLDATGLTTGGSDMPVLWWVSCGKHVCLLFLSYSDGAQNWGVGTVQNSML